MAAQRAEEFPPAIARAVGRRIGMAMGAAGIEKNRELATKIGVSESQVGRWRKGGNINWGVAPRVAKAVAGLEDVSDDRSEMRDFLELRSHVFPWKKSTLEDLDVPGYDQRVLGFPRLTVAA